MKKYEEVLDCITDFDTNYITGNKENTFLVFSYDDIWWTELGFVSKVSFLHHLFKKNIINRHKFKDLFLICLKVGKKYKTNNFFTYIFDFKDNHLIDVKIIFFFKDTLQINNLLQDALNIDYKVSKLLWKDDGEYEIYFSYDKDRIYLEKVYFNPPSQFLIDYLIKKWFYISFENIFLIYIAFSKENDIINTKYYNYIKSPEIFPQNKKMNDFVWKFTNYYHDYFIGYKLWNGNEIISKEYYIEINRFSISTSRIN